MDFNINCLRSFVAVADAMSISQAADSVGRAQSTISQQINKLEAVVGEELLSRRKGRVLGLTAEGAKLAQFARRILQLNDEAYSSLRQDTLSGSVRIGLRLDFFGRGITTWLARFKKRHPMVALEVEASQSDMLLRRSGRGEFDLAFFKQEVGARKGTVALTEQMVWVGGPQFVPVANESIPLILFPDGCAYRSFAITALEAVRRSWYISFVGPSFDCLRSALTEGLGISVLARPLVTPPLQILHDVDLPRLPAIELAYSGSSPCNARVTKELASFLTDNLMRAGTEVAVA
ncbi:DNA-binding transcriptional regulator, LysR family [Bosea sp. CRIB-10]|uniref:LysR substrate-binding domain-containing protein n=1 Tax=Bosea sp. CRIB-10 TaxID=378404 RepID=UPI0008E82535|nr:LysR substrate-binding domain-containing protein [Bosea sp. CRIB-10]SFD52337.1 DNA-binding transcriptional regulator, LysR family [Bosea sp. CRIB-10]